MMAGRAGTPTPAGGATVTGTPNDAAASARGWGLTAGTALIAGGFLGLAALQYVMPSSIVFPGSIDPTGAREWAALMLGRVPAPMGLVAFTWAMRALIALVWAGYGVLLYSGFRRGVARPEVLLTVAAVLAVLLAILFPASLTHDLYAYLGYGRMGPVYGLNPYLDTLKEVAARGDFAAAHYPTPNESVYGPVWTLLSSGVAWTVRGIAVPVQLIALKLVEAAALIGGAVAARRVARAVDERFGDLALVAFALNPVLMLEGPANGHNDVLMVALLLAGLALMSGRRWPLGFLVLGLSVGVKYMSLAIVPWLVLEQVRKMPPRRALTRAGASFALVLAPVALALLPFWEGAGTLSALTRMYSERAGHDSAIGVGLLLVAGLYAAFSVWVWRGPGDRTVAAWTVWSTCGILFAIPGVLPWYLSWPTGVAVTRWDRRQVALTVACLAVSAYWMLHYTAFRTL